MEKETNVQSTEELTTPQFRQQLNQWFEQHGVVDNLRSHLRSLMIAALQQSDISFKSHQKTTPKSQSIDLLVAEYLLKHECHYTLSILMSELPCLANFGPGAVYLRCGPSKKSKTKFHFQESEVTEIINCLGVSNNVEIGYNQNKEESLLECLLRLLPKIQLEENCQKTAEEAKDKEDYGKMMRELGERENRIQEYLRRHKEEMLKQIQIAEKNLDSRRETIDKEVTERQLHLGRIAYQWKDKHKEIMALSKHFAEIKTENKCLRARLEDMEAGMERLKLEIQEKSSIIEKLETEKMIFKNRVREYLKYRNKGDTDEVGNMPEKQTILHKTPFINENYSSTLAEQEQAVETLNSSGSPGCRVSQSEMSLTEEALLERAKVRLHVLEEESSRISEKYLKYKKKYEDDINFSCEVASIIEEEFSKTSNVEENVIEIVQKDNNRSKKEAAQQVNMEIDITEKVNETPVKMKYIFSEEKPLPTKRQEQNREYYLKSRQFLEILEKSTGALHYSSSSVTDDSPLYSLSSDSMKSLVKDTIVEEEKSTKELGKLEQSPRLMTVFDEERKRRDLTDNECLNLLKEATHSYMKTSENGKDEVHVNNLN